MRFPLVLILVALTLLAFSPASPAFAGKAGAGAPAPSLPGELPDDPLSFRPSDRTAFARRLLGLSGDGPVERLQHAYWKVRDLLRRWSTPEGFDIPVVLNESVDRHIRSLTGPRRHVFARWLVRARKYEPTIREILRRNGLPEDLVYLAMIESGFNMKACSRARAMGPWQFMDETGREYGLRVDYWVDERYDLEKSTVAAARYLKKLFDRFGCWYLVAASYNGGENKVGKAIDDRGTRDFWKLRKYEVLPRETREYVPELIAAALIAKSPSRYGFRDIPPGEVRRLAKVSVPGGLPLRDVARAYSVDLADVRALNPEILQLITPPDERSYTIALPGNGEGTREAGGREWGRRVVRVLEHPVKKKETVAAIERLYRVTGADLLLVNADGLRMEKGRVIRVPRFDSARRKALRDRSEAGG